MRGWGHIRSDVAGASPSRPLLRSLGAFVGPDPVLGAEQRLSPSGASTDQRSAPGSDQRDGDVSLMLDCFWMADLVAGKLN